MRFAGGLSGHFVGTGLGFFVGDRLVFLVGFELLLVGLLVGERVTGGPARAVPTAAVRTHKTLE